MKQKEINLLLIGEAGAGKTTMINSLANYLKFKTLKDATKSPENVTGGTFLMTDSNYQVIKKDFFLI